MVNRLWVFWNGWSIPAVPAISRPIPSPTHYIREDRKRVEQAKKRLADLDALLSRLYEDFVLGDLSKERYKKMTADYEAEQER